MSSKLSKIFPLDFGGKRNGGFQDQLKSIVREVYFYLKVQPSFFNKDYSKGLESLGMG